MSLRFSSWFLRFFTFLGCFFTQTTVAFSLQPPPADFLDSLLASAHSPQDSILSHKEDRNLTVIYSRINRGKNGIAALRDFAINREAGYYSSGQVHLPLAILALHKLQDWKDSGVTRNTIMITEAATDDQMPAYNDPRWPDGKPTMGRYISNLLLLHDDNSFDRLYELLGQAYIQDEMSKRGFDIRYITRLQSETDDASRHTNPVNFYNDKYRIILRQNAQFNNNPYPNLSSGAIPSGKGILTIESLHHLFTGIIFPERFISSEKFNLTKNDRAFILKLISQFPGETVNPFFDTTNMHENAFFDAFLPDEENVRIFCSGGMEGNQLVETAYIIDTAHAVEFFVTAAINMGEKGDINEAVDFFNFVGRQLYNYELNRPKAVKPDLQPFIISYDN